MSNWQSVTGKVGFRSWKNWEEEDYICGIFKHTQPNELNRQRNDVVITVTDHSFQTESEFDPKNGDLFKVNAATSLQGAIDKGIKEGDEIKVVYKGAYTVQKGTWKGKEGHNLEVFVKEKEKAPEHTDLSGDLL
jgi:hypothetical protein